MGWMASLPLSGCTLLIVQGSRDFRRVSSNGSHPSNTYAYIAALTCRGVAEKVGSTFTWSLPSPIKTFQHWNQNPNLKRRQGSGSFPRAVVVLNLKATEVRSYAPASTTSVPSAHSAAIILFHLALLLVPASSQLEAMAYMYACTGASCYSSTHLPYHAFHNLKC